MKINKWHNYIFTVSKMTNVKEFKLLKVSIQYKSFSDVIVENEYKIYKKYIVY